MYYLLCIYLLGILIFSYTPVYYLHEHQVSAGHLSSPSESFLLSFVFLPHTDFAIPITWYSKNKISMKLLYSSPPSNVFSFFDLPQNNPEIDVFLSPLSFETSFE